MKWEQYRKPTEESFPPHLDIAKSQFEKARSLRYGRNPGQPAAFYRELGVKGPCLGNMNIIQENPDKMLGFINLEDADAALRIMNKLHAVYPSEPAATVIKHVNPSGVAKAPTLIEAFERAWNCNELAAFGGVVGLSRIVDEDTARLLSSKDYFVEVVVAPAYSDRARELLAAKRDLRLISVGSLDVPVVDQSLEIKRVRGGLLLEEPYDTKVTQPNQLEVVSNRKPTEEELRAAIFNWIVCGYVRSNAIVIGDENRTIGIGTGQQSRIDSFRLAVWYANERSKIGSRGKVAASDAFFPNPDCVELAAREGITAIVYTLGSKRDKEIIDLANKKNIAMLVTNERCFGHF